jgi:hypothetical protein
MADCRGEGVLYYNIMSLKLVVCMYRHVAPHVAYPKSAGNNIGEEAKKAVREAVSAHNNHLPPGMEELDIHIY